MNPFRLSLSVLTCVLIVLGSQAMAYRNGDRHLLYVAVPGIRNYVEYGGVGVLVFDADNGYRFVKRILTLEEKPGQPVEAVKGVCACAKTGKLYVSTTARLMCLDLATDQVLWNRTFE